LRFRDLKVAAMFLVLWPLPAHSEECGYSPISPLVIIIHGGFVVVFLVESKV
jgi:hypothetical protein